MVLHVIGFDAKRPLVGEDAECGLQPGAYQAAGVGRPFAEGRGEPWPAGRVQEPGQGRARVDGQGGARPPRPPMIPAVSGETTPSSAAPSRGRSNR